MGSLGVCGGRGSAYGSGYLRRVTWVPLRIEVDADDPRQALPFLSLRVAGRTVEALLDTGSAGTSILGRPGLKTRSPNQPGDGRTAFGEQTGNALVGDVRCQIADRDLGTITVAVVGPGQLGRTDIIGQDILSRFRCEYRLSDGLLLLDAEHSPPPEQEIYLDAAHHVYFIANWAECAPAAAVFDTGASVTVVDQRFAAHHQDLFINVGTSAGTDASGRTIETPMAQMVGPTILGREFAESLVAIVDLSAANATLERPMDLILGWPLLSQATWIIDHAKRHATVV